MRPRAAPQGAARNIGDDMEEWTKQWQALVAVLEHDPDPSMARAPFKIAKRHYINREWTAFETLDYLVAEGEAVLGAPLGRVMDNYLQEVIENWQRD